MRANVGEITQTDFGYTFQRSLPGTGLMDYRARFYSAALGRFIQPDSIVPGAENPQAWNRYTYVSNSPINRNDPSGHWEDEGGGAPDDDDDIIDGPGGDEDDNGGSGGGGGNGKDNPRGNNYYVRSDPTLYLLGWENFETAWSIWTNSDFNYWQRFGAGAYMGAWGGAHAALAIGAAGIACGLTPACAGVVEGFLGIGGAAQTANMACGGDMCASETQDVGEKIITVIGRYPANQNLAESIGGNWLNTSMKIWNSMNPAEQWERNKQWLQEAVIRGDIIRVASKISEAIPGKPFARELEYLFRIGYTISSNGQYLYPPGH